MASNTRQFLNIAGAATTTLCTGAGTLYGLTINKGVAAGVVTIYDNTAGSGTKIATITSPAVLLQSYLNLPFNELQFKTGLTIVTSAADDITVVWSV